MSLPFITTTFMKRTVSNARRTMSSARARVTAGGSFGSSAGPSTTCSRSSASERTKSELGTTAGGAAQIRASAVSAASPARSSRTSTCPSQASSK